jgi:hypothetical protein
LSPIWVAVTLSGGAFVFIGEDVAAAAARFVFADVDRRRVGPRFGLRPIRVFDCPNRAVLKHEDRSVRGLGFLIVVGSGAGIRRFAVRRFPDFADVDLVPVVRRRTQTHEVGSVRAKLRSSALGHLSTASAQLGGRSPSQRIPDSDYESFRKAVNAATRELEQEQLLSTFEHVSVQSEPNVYGPHSEHSWFRDIAATLSQGDVFATRTAEMAPAAVEARLAKHVQDVQNAARKGDAYGRAVPAMLHESCREEDEQEHRRRADRELRVLTTGGGDTPSSAGGGAAAFVSPAFLVPLWAPYRGVERAFADACHKEPLPDFGMRVYIPVFTGTDKVAKQAEEGAVTETVPTTGIEGSAVETLTGQVIITEQLLSRGVTGGGGSFDQLIGAELAQRLDQEVDLFALNTAIAAGEAVTGETTYSTEGLYKDLALAREKLTDTAGTRLRPTHMFTTSDLYSYASRQVDANQTADLGTVGGTARLPACDGRRCVRRRSKAAVEPLHRHDNAGRGCSGSSRRISPLWAHQNGRKLSSRLRTWRWCSARARPSSRPSGKRTPPDWRSSSTCGTTPPA